MAFIYLVLGLGIFVNGATDAVNSICTPLAAGTLSYRRAVFLSAVMNFLGLVLSMALFPSVSETVLSIASGDVVCLYASLLSVSAFASVMWAFSVPTSESHALVAAVIGASLAGGGEGSSHKLLFVFFSAVLSCLLGLLFGSFATVVLQKFNLKNKALPAFGCALSSFFHGAQDGQKFVAAAIAFGLCENKEQIVLFAAVLLFIGTLCGGRRMAEKLSCRLCSLDLSSAVASDLGSAAALAIITIFGIPGGTTYTKTLAIVGTAVARGERVNRRELFSVVFGWLLTVPVCFVLAYFITKVMQ